MAKTNVVRILEAGKIIHYTFEYEVNEDELDAVSVADKINAEHEQVFKTLIAQNEKKENFVFCIPGNYELDLKKAARASGNKKIELIKVKDILSITGYIRGGCSPIGMKKLLPTYIDETAQLFDEIYISAGVRGMQVKLSPYKLAEIINANFADII